MAQLPELPWLAFLALNESSLVTGGGAGLERMTGLKELQLMGTAVDDAGLAFVRGLKQLTKLDLSDTAITGAGLQHLAGLEQLEDLRLSGTRVDDAGLLHLSGLQSLRLLAVNDSAVTRAAARKLKRKLPECNIIIRWADGGTFIYPQKGGKVMWSSGVDFIGLTRGSEGEPNAEGQ